MVVSGTKLATAQQLPSGCYAAYAQRPEKVPLIRESHNPYVSDWPRVVLREMLAAEREAQKRQTSRLDRGADRLRRLWARDSLGVEFALAFLVADVGYDGLSAARIAFDAAIYYEELSGRAAPLLYVLAHRSNDIQRAAALDAMRADRVEPTDEAAIVSFACDAAWLLIAWVADSAHARAAAGTSSAVLAAPLILQRAVRLVHGANRELLRELGAKANVPLAAESR